MAKSPLLWAILLVLCSVATFAAANVEGDALTSLKGALSDPNSVLQSWDSTLVNPCTWFHVTCNNENSVTRVDLGNAALSGILVPQLGQLKNLQYLELYSNNISGPIPDELGNLTSLVSLDLYLNKFSGQIPESLGRLSKLRFLRLNNNSLTGPIPKSLTTIQTLQVLDLSNNDLSGGVPANGSFSLFTPISFANNPGLCGAVTSKPCPGDPPFSPPPPFNQQTSVPSPGSASSTGAIAGGVAAGAALLFAAPAIGFAWWRRRKPEEYFFDVPAEEDPEVHLGQLKRFSLRELQVATDSFSNKNILGRGGFGKVYKGRLADGTLVAVKRLKEERTPGGELQFQTEVEMISMAVHRNLLRLRGFCMTPTERLLVYPYMANGSVASCLRERTPSQPPLNWPTRKRIALGSARGLSYLHDHCDPKIIHRDVKAANILLDEEFEAVVGDFGLAKLMDYKDTHVTTAVRGTIGHIAPEYLSTGKSSEKTDVFGYGVMLLDHDFAVTKRHAVFTDIQIVMNPTDILFGSGSAVSTDTAKVSRVGILPRYANSEREIRWFDVPGFNPIHTINAWDDGDDAVVLVAPNCLSVEHALELEGTVHCLVEMVRIDLRTGLVSRKPVAAENLEFGAINQKYVGKKNRYVYIGMGNPHPKISGIVKLDLEASGSDAVVGKREFGEGCFGGEPFFVANDVDIGNPEIREGKQEEDDGFVLTYVHDEKRDQSKFLVMDAKSPELDIVAEVLLPRRVPYGFHGTFLSRAEVNSQVF